MGNDNDKPRAPRQTKFVCLRGPRDGEILGFYNSPPGEIPCVGGVYVLTVVKEDRPGGARVAGYLWAGLQPGGGATSESIAPSHLGAAFRRAATEGSSAGDRDGGPLPWSPWSPAVWRATGMEQDPPATGRRSKRTTKAIALITARNVSSASLRSILSAAYIDQSVDADGAIVIEGETRLVVLPSRAKAVIRLIAGFSVAVSVSRADLLEAINELNNKFLVIRAAVDRATTSVKFQYDIPLAGGISPKFFVSAVRRYSEIPRVAAREFLEPFLGRE